MVQKQKGFTLIELMIVVAIIGIIASIGYPRYTESVSKSRRGNAQAEMLSLSSALERYYTQNNHYSNAAAAGADTGAPDATLYTIDAETAQFYTITISAVGDADTAQTYTLSAAPTGGMTGDRCGTMTLNSAGVRTAAAGETDCWR
ncbi:hypothetical protein A3765_10955 [Oleiphilus sp. HI0130]|nr:hypothetical protein A3765_21045 [Oleiphilus sp. HI0130]KZZ74997.1 hypothetical protein A3765_10955 [Oleiphilus sp. HI0130]